MKTNDQRTAFDRKLERPKASFAPSGVDEAAIFVNDTMELCWASAQTVFGDKATPDHALAIYDRVISQRITQKSADTLV